ncbi:cytochrome P450 27C1 [Narcine bancroftii]|uniref:cytochrome P450 27C1 n=1 Tax=Narcine bancroftii TaxID=1343680 RepID=UPI0038322E36
MPGPSTMRNLAEFFCRDGFNRIHDIQLQHTQQYGKIFKSHFGPQFVVSIADQDMVAQVLRSEGRAPQRAHMESWQEYRQLQGRAVGLISAEGEEWLKMRNVLKQLIMKPKDVAGFSKGLTDVISDLIKRIKYMKGGSSQTLTDVNSLFFKFAMEGIATILFESRLGCLENEICQETREYMEALELMFSMFKTTMYAGAIPKWLRPFIPKPWNEFCQSWDGLFRFSEIHVNRKVAQIKRHLEQGEEVQGGLLTYLLVSQEMTLEEIYANMTELLLAGVDTTSFTLSWSMYLLARYPAIQSAVYEEIFQNLGRDTTPTAQDLSKIPLVRCVLKETLRLFPVLPGNGRITQEDMVVGGYFIPSGTQLALCHYTTSHDSEVFERPGDFQPHRWLRKTSSEQVDSFAAIPFGYGVWSCVGRRIAEMEIHLALVQLLQAFEIQEVPGTGTVLAKTRGLLTPERPIDLKFVDRK